MSDNPIITIEDLLQDFQINVEDLKILPLCYTRKYHELVEIISQKGNLKPQESDDYDGEELLFFFYGKAKYIPNDEVKNYYGTNLPITLIFTLNENLKRFVCFDSGGYDRYKIGSLNRKNFEIENCDIEVIKKYIKLFYGSNKDYIDANIKITLDASDYPFCRPLQELLRLSKPEGDVEYGEQAFTIEIQLDKEVELTPHSIVAPLRLLSSPKGRDQWKKTFKEAKLIEYDDNDVKVVSYIKMGEVVKKTIKKMIE